jgi:hypothetical protein
MRFKPLLLLGLTACAFLAVLTARSSAQTAGTDGDADRIRVGFKIAPVPLTLRHKDPNLVGLGSYIVNAQGWCNECHSTQEWADGHDPTAGQEPAVANVATYLSGGAAFGPITSANLTPDASGLPAGLTFARFFKTFKTGLDPGNGHPAISPYLQVMPWPYHRNQTHHDLAAIYEYLSAIPPLPSPAGAAGPRLGTEETRNGNSSAQNADSSSVGDDDAARIRIGFEVTPVPVTLRGTDPNLVGLGSYIVNTRTTCNHCHTQPQWETGHNPFMGQFPAMMNAPVYLAGGRVFGPFVSRNLTPDAHHLPGGLTFTQFVKLIRTGVDPDNVHPTISPLLQVMPWPYFRNMTDHDLAAIYVYLRAIPALPSASGTPP